MRRMTAVLSAAALVLSTVSAFAQAKPSFAGKWTLVPPPADPAATPPAGGGRGGRGGGGWGMENTITQDATTLTIEYMGGGQNPAPIKVVYKLDGTESKNSIMRGGQATEVVSKAAWDGNKLVITTTTQMGEQKRVVSLEGGMLIIENTTPGRDGGPPNTSKATYKKAS